jgi:hypothetical protein
MRTRSSRDASSPRTAPARQPAPVPARRLGRLRRRPLEMASSTSPFSTWPRLPEPEIWSTERLLSAISFAAAGAGGMLRGSTGRHRRRSWRSRPRPACRSMPHPATRPATPLAAWSPEQRPRHLPKSTQQRADTDGLAFLDRDLGKDAGGGGGTSTVTLSVSSSTSGSSAAIASPTFLNHLPMVASVTDSPRVGTRISVAIVPVRF